MDTSDLLLPECEQEAGTVHGHCVPMACETLPQILSHHLSLPVFLSVSYFFSFNIVTASSLTLHMTDKKIDEILKRIQIFRLEFYMQRQEVWALKFTHTSWDNNGNILIFYDIFPPKR